MLQYIISWGSVLLTAAICLNTSASSLPTWVPGAKPAAHTVSGPITNVRARNVHAIVQSIIGQESNWNYLAVNSDSGALGFAQIMPSNVGPWAKEAGEGWVTPNRFLRDPALQKRIIYFKIGQYYDSALKLSKGDVEVAVMMVAAAWYSGQMGLYNNWAPQYYNGRQYPSIGYYSHKALKSAKANGLKIAK